MEDSNSMEWEIQNYHGEEEDVEEVMIEKTSKLDWIVKAGLSIGKKFVISGMLILSAPLVLPPLVVISALGVASSVPFGVVYASYACTETLMSKLLPPPSQSADYEELLGEEGGEAELRNEEDYYSEKQHTTDWIGGTPEFMENNQPLLELREDEKPSSHAAGMGPEFGVDFTARDSDLMPPEVKNKEDRQPVGQNMRSLEEFGLEKRLIEDAKDNISTLAVHIDAVSEDAGREYVKNGKERQHLLGDKNAKEEEVLLGMKSSPKDRKPHKTEKEKSSSTEIERKGKKKNLTASKSSGKKKGQKGDKVDVLQVKTGKIGDVGKQLHPEVVAEERHTNDGSSFTSVKGQTGKREFVLLGSVQNLPLNRKSEVQTHVVEDQRPPEDDFSSVHNKNADETAEYVSAENSSRFNEVKQVETGKHGLGMAPLTRKSELKQDVEKSVLREANMSDSDLQCGEGSDGDEKIWRQIDAIRRIVGCKAPRHPSYFEELRALYVFTGVDPPSLVAESSSLGEFYARLQFLKSIIGVI